jgi:hypothetical protein
MRKTKAPHFKENFIYLAPMRRTAVFFIPHEVTSTKFSLYWWASDKQIPDFTGSRVTGSVRIKKSARKPSQRAEEERQLYSAKSDP